MFGWEHRGKLTEVGATSASPLCLPGYGELTDTEAALQLSAVWACIRLLGETVGTLPLIVYREQGEAKVRATEHPLYELLHDAPNADMTALEFWEGVVVSLCTEGNAYAQKRRLNGRLVALEPLRAEAMEVFRTSRGRRRYRYHGVNPIRELDEDDVFHVKGFGNGGDVGLSPIAFARLTLYGARMLQRTAAEVAATGNRQQGVLTVDAVIKDEAQRQKLRDNVIRPFVEGKTMVLEGGMKFQPTTLSPEDAQMLESRKFSIEEICQWFRVPPFMIGHTEKTTSWGTGLEQQQIGFLTFALEPYLERIEQAIRRSLIEPRDRAAISAEFLTDKLLRADSAARSTFYAKALGAGGHRPWMSVNEVRAKENLPKTADGDDMTPPMLAAQGAGNEDA